MSKLEIINDKGGQVLTRENIVGVIYVQAVLGL